MHIQALTHSSIEHSREHRNTGCSACSTHAMGKWGAQVTGREQGAGAEVGLGRCAVAALDDLETCSSVQ